MSDVHKRLSACELKSRFDQVVGDPHARHADRRFAFAPPYGAGDARVPHQSLNPLAAHANALVTQIEVQPAHAIAVAAAAVDLRNPLAQPGIDERLLGRAAALPGIEARAADLSTRHRSRFPREEGRGFFQDLALLAQDTDLAT